MTTETIIVGQQLQKKITNLRNRVGSMKTSISLVTSITLNFDDTEYLNIPCELCPIDLQVVYEGYQEILKTELAELQKQFDAL